MESQNKQGWSAKGGKRRVLLTFCWTVVIMVVIALVDNDPGPEYFPYVDGGTILFFFLIIGLSQMQVALVDGLPKPKVIHMLMPFLSNISAIAAILGFLFAWKAVV